MMSAFLKYLMLKKHISQNLLYIKSKYKSDKNIK